MADYRSGLKIVKDLCFSIAVIFGAPILIWFVVYPFFGYSEITMNAASGFVFLLGLYLVVVLGFDWKEIGLGLDKLGEAFLGISAAYAIFFVVGTAANQFGLNLTVLREHYSFGAILCNWGLTALGEEIIFAGVLFNLVMRTERWTRRWAVVLIVAVLFALWHLPGYIAVALKMGFGSSLFFRLLINFSSWLVFGTIYAVSGNVWLAALAHASTDYTLLPMTIESPLVGLAFMVFLIIYGAFSPWKRTSGGRAFRVE